MPFLELRLELGRLDPDAVEAACFAAGALSITLSDAADTPLYEPLPGSTPLWPSVALAALFPADASRERVAALLQAALAPARVEPDWSVLEDRPWEREWLKDFRPQRHGGRLWVCPQGEAPPDPAAVVLQLDPGLAFGTGTHPTTALCLAWLDGALLENRRVLDVGCGSGILALAALALGAKQALAVDIDPQALLATQENAAKNGSSARLTVQDAALDWPDGQQIVLANILAEPLIALSARIARAAAPRATLVLSGLLLPQADAVAEAYTPWFDMKVAGARDGWALLTGQKRT